MNIKEAFLCISAMFYVASCGAKKCNTVTEFQCENGQGCIHKSWRCDGEEDCKDRSDERNCKRQRCEETQFKCKNKKCISKSLRCDSVDNCGDNSDEVGCSTFPSFSCNFEGAFRCAGTDNCIDGKNVCNKHKDCPNGDDESKDCGVNECLVSNGGCSQICHDLAIGFKCSCKPGFVLQNDGNSCADIDECATYGTCEQQCQNTAGSYKCQCTSEYTLQPDGRSCKAKGKEPSLMIANLVDISQFSLDDADSSRIVYGKAMGGCLAMDVNPHDGHVYWADYVKKTISRVHLNDTKNVAVIVNGKLTRAEGIAVDWIGNNIYWTNADEAKIEVSDVNGRFRKTLFDTGLQMPRGIAVAPAKRFVFWSDWGSNPKIERSSMDGADRKTILGSDTLRWPNAVAVDQLLNRLYWVDSGNGYIASSDFDGKDVRQIITSNTVSSFGLAVFEGSLFWTQTRGNVFRASKFDGRNKREIRGAYFKPYTVHINHVAAKPKHKNPCEKKNGGCEHLCLLSSVTDQGYSCQCRNGFVLKAGQKSCRMN